MAAAQKDTILFIHGLTHGAWCWNASFIPYFEAKGYQCMAINLDGHEKPGFVKGIHKYSLQDYVNTVAAIVAKMDSPPIIVGHSMGGRILQLYLKQGGVCKKGILVASVPPSGAFMASCRIIKRHPGSLRFLVQRDFLSFGKAYPSAFLHEDLPKDKVEAYKDFLCSESFKAYLQMMLPIKNTEKVNDFPILVIGGDKDKLFTVKEFEQTAKRYNADLKIVANASHDLMLDPNNLETAEYLHQWISA